MLGVGAAAAGGYHATSLLRKRLEKSRRVAAVLNALDGDVGIVAEVTLPGSDGLMSVLPWRMAYRAAVTSTTQRAAFC
jgi:hypothetical protein